MKRETLRHPKTYDLASRLGCSRPEALGFLTLLWDFTADMATDGSVGRWPDGSIAGACDWRGQADEFICALVDAGWLDRDPTHRLLVHDWHDHCERWVKAKLDKAGKKFATQTVEQTTEPTVEPTTERLCSTRPNQTKPNQTKPNQTKPNQTPPDASVVDTKNEKGLEEEETIFGIGKRLGIQDDGAIPTALQHGWDKGTLTELFREFERRSPYWVEIKNPLALLASWLRKLAPTDRVPWPNGIPPPKPAAPKPQDIGGRVIAAAILDWRRLPADRRPDVDTRDAEIRRQLIAAGLPQETIEKLGYGEITNDDD